MGADEGAPGLRRLVRQLGAEKVLVRPDGKSAALARRVAELKPDLVVSWFWTTRLPPSLVACARLGGFGVHPSLLPRHRGPDPTAWAILARDEHTGVTAHRLAAEYDTGEILGARALRIDPRWNAWELAKALDRPSLALLRETARRFAEGEVEGTAQDERNATWAPLPSDSDLVLRLHEGVEPTLRRVRAYAPAPGAAVEVAGKALTILRARRYAGRLPLEPGEVGHVEGKVVLGASDGALEVELAELDDVRLAGRALWQAVRDLAPNGAQVE